MNKILICSFLFCNVFLVDNIINVYASISDDFIHTIILQFKRFKQIKMQNSKMHIRHCLLYEFQMGHKTTQATSNICRALGPGTVSQPMAHRWFKRFSSGNFDLQDEPRSERSDKLVLDGLKEMVERDPRQSTRCLASILGCSHTTIEGRLHEMGYRSMLGGWVPHDLTWCQQNQRIDICTNLLSLRRTYQWLNHIIAGDEKWVHYTNIIERRQ